MFSVHFRKFDIFVGYEVKLNKKNLKKVYISIIVKM